MSGRVSSTFEQGIAGGQQTGERRAAQGAQSAGGAAFRHEIGRVAVTGDVSQDPASRAAPADVREEHTVQAGGHVVF